MTQFAFKSFNLISKIEMNLSKKLIGNNLSFSYVYLFIYLFLPYLHDLRLMELCSISALFNDCNIFLIINRYFFWFLEMEEIKKPKLGGGIGSTIASAPPLALTKILNDLSGESDVRTMKNRFDGIR